MTPVAVRPRQHRKALHRAGLRPMEIWVPKTRAKGFDLECRRQAQLIAKADDADLSAFLETAARTLDGWEA